MGEEQTKTEYSYKQVVQIGHTHKNKERMTLPIAACMTR